MGTRNYQGLDSGTKKHNYLETAIKTCNGYKLNANGFINDRIYTIDDIAGSHKYGKLNLEYFVKTGIREKYPDIFSLIAALVTKGYHIYARLVFMIVKILFLVLLIFS